MKRNGVRGGKSNAFVADHRSQSLVALLDRESQSLKRTPLA